MAVWRGEECAGADQTERQEQLLLRLTASVARRTPSQKDLPLVLLSSRLQTQTLLHSLLPLLHVAPALLSVAHTLSSPPTTTTNQQQKHTALKHESNALPDLSEASLLFPLCLFFPRVGDNVRKGV